MQERFSALRPHCLRNCAEWPKNHNLRVGVGSKFTMTTIMTTWLSARDPKSKTQLRPVCPFRRNASVHYRSMELVCKASKVTLENCAVSEASEQQQTPQLCREGGWLCGQQEEVVERTLKRSCPFSFLWKDVCSQNANRRSIISFSAVLFQISTKAFCCHRCCGPSMSAAPWTPVHKAANAFSSNPGMPKMVSETKALWFSLDGTEWATPFTASVNEVGNEGLHSEARNQPDLWLLSAPPNSEKCRFCCRC